MYPTLLFLSVLSFADRPAIAEKSSDLSGPAVAEFEWGKRQPPEKIFPTFCTDEFKDLQDRLPIKVGMTTAEVAKTIEKEAVEFPNSSDRYELWGGRPIRNLPEQPISVATTGRGLYLCLVFMKDDHVESIWCQSYIPQTSSDPPFVLSGDPKPRKAVERYLHTYPPWE